MPYDGFQKEWSLFSFDRLRQSQCPVQYECYYSNYTPCGDWTCSGQTNVSVTNVRMGSQDQR